MRKRRFRWISPPENAILGGVLHHVSRGPKDSTPVLLLHGFLGSHRNLGALIRAWSRADPTIRLVSADLLGHGRSPPLPPGAGLETMATEVLELLPHLEAPRPPRAVGHSLGGRVLLMAKRLAPGALGPIDLLDISPSPIERRAANLAGVAGALLSAPERADTRETIRDHLLAQGISRPIVEWLLMNLERTDEGVAWAVDRQALAEFDGRASPEDLWDTIDDTVTCIRGAASPYVSDEDAARLENLGAHVHTIEGAGHFVHVDATEQVLKALLTEEVRGTLDGEDDGPGRGSPIG